MSAGMSAGIGTFSGWLLIAPLAAGWLTCFKLRRAVSEDIILNVDVMTAAKAVALEQWLARHDMVIHGG